MRRHINTERHGQKWQEKNKNIRWRQMVYSSAVRKWRLRRRSRGYTDATTDTGSTDRHIWGGFHHWFVVKPLEPWSTRSFDLVGETQKVTVRLSLSIRLGQKVIRQSSPCLRQTSTFFWFNLKIENKKKELVFYTNRNGLFRKLNIPREATVHHWQS